MAWINTTISKTDTTRETVDGQRSMHWPAFSPPLTKQIITEGACDGCLKKVTHGVARMLGVTIPHGEHRYQRVPAANRLLVDDINLVQSAIAVMAHAAHGQIDDGVAYNANSWMSGDQPGNASQSWTYEIIAASGNTLTIKGDNPKRLKATRNLLNPNYGTLEPAPSWMRSEGLTDAQWDDSANQSQPNPAPPYYNGLAWQQYIPYDVTCCMAVGWTVEYLSPSALAGKNNPMITRVLPPTGTAATDVTFDVELSIACDDAKQPIDANAPPPSGKYYCRVRGELLYPPRYLHVIAPRETAFTRTTVDYTTDAIHDLLDTGGNNTRVLWPGMMDGAIVAQLFNGSTPGPYVNVLELYLGQPRLKTTDPAPNTWSTTLDLRGLGIGTTYTKCTVTYHPQARAVDTYRIMFQSGCSHSYVDPTGSYKHDATHRCAAVSSTGFATYRGAQCWKPGSCNRFALGDRAHHYGTQSYLPDDASSATFWSGLWHRHDWILRQKAAGVSSPPATAYILERRQDSGPSFTTVLGAVRDTVPAMTGVATREPYWPAAAGRRYAWTHNGHDHQQIVHGAFALRPMDFTADGGPDLRYDAAQPPINGALPQHVTGWMTKTDPLGNALPAGLAMLPYRLTGGLQPYEYMHGGASLGRSNDRWTSADMAIATIDMAEPGDPALKLFVTARFAP